METTQDSTEKKCQYCGRSETSHYLDENGEYDSFTPCLESFGDAMTPDELEMALEDNRKIENYGFDKPFELD